MGIFLVVNFFPHILPLFVVVCYFFQSIFPGVQPTKCLESVVLSCHGGLALFPNTNIKQCMADPLRHLGGGGEGVVHHFWGPPP